MKNRANVGVNKLIKWLSVFLAIAIVLGAIFLADILSWIRNIPEFSSGSEEEPSEEEVTPAPEAQSLCPVRVGGISKDKMIFFCPNFDMDCTDKTYSKLVWEGDNANADINVQQSFVFDWINKDENIGRVRTKMIYLSQDVLEGKSEGYDSIKESLPAPEFLKNLNGAYYIAGNLICRKERLT